MKFLQGLVSQVSAADCRFPCPGSLRLGLKTMHPDHAIWLNSYKEEYFGLLKQQTFDIIDNAKYRHIITTTGKMPIPSMCILNIKKDAEGRPSRAKSLIVVLGNKDFTQWTKADCYAPMV